MQKTLIAPSTQNTKLGMMACSYRTVGDSAKGSGTCPSNCPLLPEHGGKCYTRKFLVNLQQKHALDRNDDFDKFLFKGATTVRLNVSGDIFMSDGNGGCALDVEYLKAIIDWAIKNPKVTVYTYTHNPIMVIEAGYSYIGNSFPSNLHIVASVDTIEEKNMAVYHGFRSARVIDKAEDKLADETFCPYDLALHEGRKPNVTCASCRLCFEIKHKKNIAFLKQK